MTLLWILLKSYLARNIKLNLKLKKDGYITEIIANEIGVASMMLGAGRQTKEDVIDLGVGIVLNKK